MKEFCPRCGKETGPFVRGFCFECMREKVKLVEIPENIEIEHCKHCKRIRIEGKWKPLSNWLLIDAVKAKVKGKELVIKDTEIELFPLEDGNTIASVKIIGSIDSKALALTGKSSSRPKQRCAMTAAGLQAVTMRQQYKSGFQKSPLRKK